MALEEIRQISSHRQWPHARGRHRTPTPMRPPPIHTHERRHVRHTYKPRPTVLDMSGIRLPHKLHPLRTNNSPKYYVSFQDRIRETAYVWDKSYAIGRNRAKGKIGDGLTTAAKCTDCDYTTDNMMAHMLLQCTHPEVAQIREHAFQTQQTQLDKLHRQRHPPPWFHNALTKMARAAWDPTTPQVERYWTGHLTASQLANAFGCNISTSLLEHQFHKLEKPVTKILLLSTMEG
eukprot:CAMPEP_0185042942 /NCGR_PEP_ID=MMETSP1103-20130426/42635_1 /TAXON_ID=36769 /ORGANISM="Paraphysomonas bandaiensis, Strain Caron Lab Isolate" /LENGTH=232 /DNA_ID=CAMNT_0027583075 /DNA_START=655 /DNA_END=1354 /DNA_ORIENTATION=-